MISLDETINDVPLWTNRLLPLEALSHEWHRWHNQLTYVRGWSDIVAFRLLIGLKTMTPAFKPIKRDHDAIAVMSNALARHPSTSTHSSSQSALFQQFLDGNRRY